VSVPPSGGLGGDRRGCGDVGAIGEIFGVYREVLHGRGFPPMALSESAVSELLGVLRRELGAEPAAVAVAWLLRNPVVSTAIVGATTIEELRSDLGALSVQLDDDVMKHLDQIWPGPGEAPRAYAW